MISELLSPVLSSLTARDVISPILGGLFGWFAAIRMSRSNEKIAEANRQETHVSKMTAAEMTAADGLTRRFQVLMDGYEIRIRDLTNEVSRLRSEVERLAGVLTNGVSQFCPAAHDCAVLQAAIKALGTEDASKT